MTPKEKATELVAKFTRIEDDTTFYWEPYYDTRYSDEEVLPHAVKCSIVVCDELIEQSKDANYGGFLLFWEAVKTELQSF